MTCEAFPTFCKDDSEVLDYKVDWTAWLSSEIIVSSNWEVPANITQDASTNDDTSGTIWLSGGVLGESYEITNTIVTDAIHPRTASRSFIIIMGDR